MSTAIAHNAAVLAELGHGTRLAAFTLIAKAGAKGLTVGQIQAKLDVPWSTLSFHLARLAHVGLIEREQHSRTIHCRAKAAALKGLLEWVAAECQPEAAR